MEDDHSIRESIVEVLKQEGYTQVVDAANGAEALKLIELLDKPCLILLDLVMPEMDGFNFLSKIKTSALKDVAHVIVITAMSKLDIEGVRVVKKPFDLDAFLHEIYNFMSDDAKDPN